ncbi:MAG: hypothetical protein PVG90_11060 [Bacillota bacterium]|jgi:hypothetical protein
MFKNLRILILFCLIAYSLLKLPPAQARDYAITLDFDQVKPVASITRTATIMAAFTAAKVDGIRVKVNRPLSGAVTHKTVPAGRMRLLVNGQPFQLANSTVTINFADRIRNAAAINLALELTFNPEDPADRYHGAITLKTWANNAAGAKEWNNVINVKLTAVIQPWIKIQQNPPVVILEKADYGAGKLVNRQPLQLRIAANSNWVLTCKLTGDCLLKPSVKILAVNPTNRAQVLNPDFTVTANRRNLALGPATVAANRLWTELRLNIEIKDFTKYPAGKYTIPLQFAAFLWGPKDPIP